MNDLEVSDDPDLRAALHAAVSGGPEAPPLDRLLAEAHRARRGRAVRRAAGGLAVAAAMAGVALAGAQLLSPGDEDRTGVANPSPREEVGPSDLWVHVTQDGRLVASPGTTIERTVADPLHRRPGGRSWGVAVRRGDDELWGLVDWSDHGTFSSVEPARARFAALEDWLDYEVAASTGTIEPHPVAFAPDGNLIATGPTRIVQEGDGIDLGPAPEGTMTAAAQISVRGERQWVLARLEPRSRPTYVVLRLDRADGFMDLVDRAPSLWAGATR